MVDATSEESTGHVEQRLEKPTEPGMGSVRPASQPRGPKVSRRREEEPVWRPRIGSIL